MFSGDPTALHTDWVSADPTVWCPSLARQMLTTGYNSQPPQANATSLGAFNPVKIPSAAAAVNSHGWPQQSVTGSNTQPIAGPSAGYTAQFPALGTQGPVVPPPHKPAKNASAKQSKTKQTLTSTFATDTTTTAPTPSKQKKRKANTSVSLAPLAESAEELAAKQKRARRFERELGIEKQREAGLIPDDDDDNVNGQARLSSQEARDILLGKAKGKRAGRRGKGSFDVSGYDQEPEADPVSNKGLALIRLATQYVSLQNVINWDRYTIKGTSEQIEKSYLRLTSVSSRHVLFAIITQLHICIVTPGS